MILWNAGHQTALSGSRLLREVCLQAHQRGQAPEAQGYSLGESAEGISDKFRSARRTRIR